MANDAFTVHCGNTKIDLNQVSNWNDKNNDEIESKDEFVYKDRYFNDKEWGCYEKFLKKAKTPDKIDLTSLSVPNFFPEKGRLALKELLTKYSEHFLPGTLSLTIQIDINFYPLDQTKISWQQDVYNVVLKGKTKSGYAIDDARESYPPLHSGYHTDPLAAEIYQRYWIRELNVTVPQIAEDMLKEAIALP